MSFITEMQEEAQKELQLKGCYVGDNLILGDGDLDSLISQVVQNFADEIERRVEGMKDIEIVDYHDMLCTHRKKQSPHRRSIPIKRHK